ncbi:MAG: PpiC-type peptidyl-prolyl cis-trans isomerase [Bryobacterales bacterium]|nr:PpiC-type peptidyl-prolyl cis-trans isomerase [Bryobacterales bacterium]
MFDLFRSRDKAVRFLLSGLLLLVALSMVTYLIPSYGSGDRAQDTVVAQIGKDTITMRDAQLAIQGVLKGRSVPPELVSLYVPQVIEQMITERTLAYEAQRLGLKVSDEDTFNVIRINMPQLFPDGKFVGRDTYAAMLAQQNLSIPEFEGDTARQILVNRLRQVVVEGTIVTPAEIQQEFRRRNEKVSIEYVKISPEKMKAEVQVTPAEMKDYFEKNRMTFPVPEKRSVAILMIDQSKLEQALSPAEADLRKAYDADKDKFRTPERVKVRHILLKTSGKAPEEDAKMKAKADDLLKQIKGGADFAELARKNSEDPSSAVKGGDLDWIVRGQTVKPFEDATFSLKPKETSNVVKTEYGYHIIQVLDHEQAHLKTFDEVKAQLSNEYRKQRVNQALQDLLDRVQAALKKEPPEKVAKDQNLAPPTVVQNIAPGDPLPEIGVNKDFEQSIAGLQKGEVSQPVSLPQNRIAMAVVTNVIPTHPAAFEEAQARIRQTLEQQKADQLTSKRADELLAKANGMNGDLAKAAKSMGLEVKTPGPVDRSGAVEGLGQAGYVSQAFTKPDGAVFGPIALPDGRVIVKVLSHIAPDMSQLEAQRSGVRDELKSKKARERNELFEAGLREQLIKEGKVKIHQDVVNRLVANYRG